jgi:hypothetical protein
MTETHNLLFYLAMPEILEIIPRFYRIAMIFGIYAIHLGQVSSTRAAIITATARATARINNNSALAMVSDGTVGHG